MNKIIITIDGKVATGKTTISEEIAKKLNASCLFSGKLYRLFTLYLFKKYKTQENVKNNFKKEFQTIKFIFKDDNFFISNFIYEEKELFSQLVMKHIDFVAHTKEVREFLNNYFRRIVNETNNNFIVEGRDAGTIIFPNADFKFFLEVSDEVAAKRRKLQLNKISEEKTIEDIKNDNLKRNNSDSKEVSIVADDAFKVDTTFLSKEEVVLKIMKLIEESRIKNEK